MHRYQSRSMLVCGRGEGQVSGTATGNLTWEELFYKLSIRRNVAF